MALKDGILRDRRALLTGATGGLGPGIAEALAGAGASLVLSALPEPALGVTAERLAAAGARVVAVPADLRDPGASADLAERARAAFGGIDLLVHNAGLERVGRFESQSLPEMEAVVRVNLLSAMHLARVVVPDMLAGGWGRLVFVSSLSGKVGPAHVGPYAASKAGLVALGRSIRAEYRGRGISASTVVPGFVRDVGMYARGQRQTGFRSSWILRTIPPESVVRAVMRALERDLPEVLVQPGPTRLSLALGELMPRLLGQRLSLLAGADRLFRQWSDARAGERDAGAAEGEVSTRGPAGPSSS